MPSIGFLDVLHRPAIDALDLGGPRELVARAPGRHGVGVRRRSRGPNAAPAGLRAVHSGEITGPTVEDCVLAREKEIFGYGSIDGGSSCGSTGGTASEYSMIEDQCS